MSPEQLATAAADAEQTLDACEAEGCDRAEAARAAFVLAVHTYVEEGVADPQLAATVRVLDETLFEDLPDVVQARAGEPLGWASWVGGAEIGGPSRPVTSGVHEPPEGDDIDPRKRITIQIVDEAGAPIPTGAFRFTDEQDTHVVNRDTGAWIGSVRYLPDGSERGFDRGDAIQLVAFAPGYDTKRVMFLVGKRKKQRTIRVQLSPYAPTAETDLGRRAIAAWTDWSKAYTAWSAKPSDPTEVQERRAAGAQIVREWLHATRAEDAPDAASEGDAFNLCLQLATNDADCN